MKKEIHPDWYAETPVTCLCGNTWTTASTKETIRVQVCSRCHPFYTGTQRLVDTGGQVERLRRRYNLQ
jgi:large subunit ribosomal protein L31